MDKLDENYLDLVRKRLYKKQPNVSTKQSIKRSKNSDKLEIDVAGNEETPKNIVNEAFKTKKEAFKAKLQNKLKKKIKSKQVTFINNSSKVTPESSGSKESHNDVKNRVATPYRNVKLIRKLAKKDKSPMLNELQDCKVEIAKELSPSFNENGITLKYLSNIQGTDLELIGKNDTNVKSKKRLLSESGSPKVNIKRKKEKSFTKTGKKLLFQNSSDEDHAFDKGTIDIEQTTKVIKKSNLKSNATDKSLNINFTIDGFWQSEAESNLNTKQEKCIYSPMGDTNKKKAVIPRKKLTNKIGNIDGGTSYKNQQNGDTILVLDNLKKDLNLKPTNLPTGLVPLNKKSDHKNTKKNKTDRILKPKRKDQLTSMNIARKVLHSSDSSSDDIVTTESSKNSSNVVEDTTELSDSYGTVGVKGLKFQRFCNLFIPTHNETLLGQNNTFNTIPKRYFTVSKNELGLDWQCEKLPSLKQIKSNGNSRSPNKLLSEAEFENSRTEREITDSKHLNKKNKQKSKINILDIQILGKKLQDSVNSRRDQGPVQALDSQKNFIDSSEQMHYLSNEKIQKRKPIFITLKNQSKIVILDFGALIHFHGLCRIKVLNGEIEVLGAGINSSSGEKNLYSPRGTALLYIKNSCTLIVDSSIKLKDLVPEDLLLATDANLTFKHHCAIFSCSRLTEPHIDFIERYVSQIIFPESVGQELRVDFKLQGSWNKIHSSEKWEDILKKITKSSRTVISGGKGVGKSTFLRYAVNFLLRNFKKIRIIDLDPGQSEFHSPGCISVVTVEKEVLGPNYTHLLDPESSILSHINIGYDIKKYLTSVKYLLKSTKSMNAVPSLINFPGFTQGIGFDISAQTLKLLDPTCVIQIDSKTYSKNYKVDLTADNVTRTLDQLNILSEEKYNKTDYLSYDFVKFDSLAENNEAWSLEARQGREMNILSYFGKLMTDNMKDLTSEDVNMYSINISALSITNLEGKVILPAAVNANLVALCSKLDKDLDIFSCYGYGFVRGIDLQTDTLVLITPESINTLGHVSHIVLSSVTTPPSLIMTAGGLKGHIPYVNVGDLVDFGQFTKRSYLPPRK